MSTHHRPRRRTAIVIPALTLCAGFAAFNVTPLMAADPVSASEVVSEADQKTQAFKLPAGSLAASLNRLARQAELTLSVNPAIIEGKTASAISGEYTARQVLQLLLQDSGVVFSFTGENTVALRESAGSGSDGAMVLGTVRVEGRIEKTVEGYVAKRSATATKLNLSPRETPQSITVVTEKLIVDADLRSITEVVNQVVGLSAKEFDSTRHAFSARGFDIFNIQIDGIPTSWEPGYQAGETQMDTIIYDRIEIVRGASGLTTGAGDPSAAINMVRKHADSEVLTGSAALGVGSWNKYQGTVDVSSPLNQDASVRGRFIASYEEKDSFRDFAHDEKVVLYGVVDADITKDTKLSLGASYQNNQPTGTTWGGLSSWFSDGTPTDWDRSKSTAADWTSWSSTQQNYFINMGHYFNNDVKLSANYSHTQNDADLRLLFIFGAANKATGEGLGAYPYWAETSRKQDSLDVYFTSPFEMAGQTHEATAGLMYSKQVFTNHTRSAINADPIGNFYNWDGSYAEPDWAAKELNRDYSKTEQLGLYGAVKISLSEPAKLILGTRISNWKTDEIRRGKTNKFSHDKIITPYAGFLYDLNKNHTAYVSYTSIFKPQTERDKNGNYLEPIEGNNYEAGIKGEYINGKLIAGLSVFKIEQDKLAQADGVNTVLDTIDQAYIEAEGATSEGFELEVSGQLAKGWNLSAGWSQFEAKDAQNEKVNTQFPRKMAKLFTTYQFQNSLKDLTIGGGVNWQSEHFTETENPVGETVKLKQKAYSLVNLMARYDIKKNISAQLNIKNLFDEKYFSQIGFFKQHAFGEPRNITMNIQYRF